MSNDNKEAKKEELLEQQEARQLTEEELAQVTGGGKEDLEKHGLEPLGGAVATPGGGASQLLN